MIQLPLLRFCLVVLSRVRLGTYENNNMDEMRKIKCNYLLFGLTSHVSVEILPMLRFIREPKIEQKH